MLEEFSHYPDTETGGVWLGKVCADHWYITDNLRPGPKAQHLPGCFAYDYEDVLAQAQKRIVESCEPISIVGYWHSHTSGNCSPSMDDASLNEQYAALRPEGALCGIVTNHNGFCLTLYQATLPLRYEKINFYITEE